MTTSLSDECPIWESPASVERLPRRDSLIIIESPRAGVKYRMEESVVSEIHKQLTDEEKALLTTWLIRQHEMGINEIPLLTSAELSKSSLSKLRPLSVIQRGDNILKYLNSKIKRLGGFIDNRNSDNPYNPVIDNPYWPYMMDLLAWSESLNNSELEFILDYLEEKNWIKKDNLDIATVSCWITPQGYHHLMELESTVQKSSQASIAMWFHESMNQVFHEGIVPAIEEAGYVPMRIDQKEHEISYLWQELKQGYYATYHRISPQHLQRSVKEFAGRHSVLSMDKVIQSEQTVKGLSLEDVTTSSSHE